MAREVSDWVREGLIDPAQGQAILDADSSHKGVIIPR